ncbi:MAG TPA: LLM class F420-dependent oxidoreductase [Candidatus Binataceae bacterium]|nr:LLM class F420-dependent oxidoreductase [Candidatus Binataceae bacterium]
MKAGISFANSGPFSRPDLFAQLARDAEELGFESIWTVEHVIIPQPHMPYPGSKDGQMPGGDSVAIPDPLIPLAYAAAITSKIKLATGIVIVPQRHPLYLAKQLATLDVLSHGRVILGIGSGWMKEEFEAVDVPFNTRGARTDESIQAMRALWSATPASFHGKYYHFHEAKSLPKPVQAGGVPIHVGGYSAAAARRAARFGDGFFPTIVQPDKLKEIFAQVREEAGKAGRDSSPIEFTAMAAAKLDAVKATQDVGVHRVIFGPPSSDPMKLRAGLERIANEIIAKL